MIVEKKELSREGIRELERIAENAIEDIKNIEDIGEFLDYDVLDIKREQSLIDGEWETLNYEFCLGCGGPGIWVDTSGKLIVAWSGDYLEIQITNEKVMEKLKEIEDYLNEIYG